MRKAEFLMLREDLNSIKYLKSKTNIILIKIIKEKKVLFLFSKKLINFLDRRNCIASSFYCNTDDLDFCIALGSYIKNNSKPSRNFLEFFESDLIDVTKK